MTVHTGSMKKLLGVVAVLLVIAAPARASTVTLNFSGTVDLSGVGGAASNTFSGSVTWDPAAAPFNTGSVGGGSFADYTPVAESFTLNSTDSSAQILSPVIEIDDNISPGFDLSSEDGFTVLFPLTSISVATGTSLLDFSASVGGPTSMFSSTTLPGNVNFLESSPSFKRSVWVTQFRDHAPVRTTGSFTPTPPAAPAPEADTLLLLGTGLMGMAAARRKWFG